MIDLTSVMYLNGKKIFSISHLFTQKFLLEIILFHCLETLKFSYTLLITIN